MTEPGCAALGTVLGLGTLVIPGLPGTIESTTGLPLATLPIALQPELAAFVDTLLFVQGSGCGLLPLAAERTVCASDDDLAAACTRRAQPAQPDPRLAGAAGRLLAHPGPDRPGRSSTPSASSPPSRVPGAAEVVAALNEAADCGLRTRFTNVEPPEVPPDPAPVAPPSPPAPPAVAPLPVARAPVFAPVPVPLPVVVAPAEVAIAPADATALPAPVSESVPRWLQWLAVAALVAFLYRALAPPREQSP